MIQPDSNIYLLIAKYGTGKITEEEYYQLKAWMDEDSNNTKIFSEYLVFLKNAQRVRFSDTVDEQLAWKTILSKLEKRRKISIRPYLKYAAMILALVSLAIVYQLLDKPTDDTSFVAENHVISPGKPKAILELGNGRTIDLEGLNDSSLMLDDGLAVMVSNETLDYSEVSPGSHLVNTIKIPKGGEYTLVLSDGTKIWLNSDSELSFPVKFTGGNRKITLKGEAYLEVARDENAPFLVDVNGIQVEVLGTSFNVKAYDKVETTLVEGKVSIHANASTNVILKPGDQGIVDTGNNGVSVRQVDTRIYTSWVNGMFMFRSMTLEEIMETFGRWYDVTVSYENESLRRRHFTGNLKRYDEIGFHLEVISLTTNVDFKITGNHIMVVNK